MAVGRATALARFLLEHRCGPIVMVAPLALQQSQYNVIECQQSQQTLTVCSKDFAIPSTCGRMRVQHLACGSLSSPIEKTDCYGTMENTRILFKLPILESMQKSPAAHSRLQPSHRSAIAQTFRMRRGAGAAPACSGSRARRRYVYIGGRHPYELNGFPYEASRRAASTRQDSWI